MKNNAKAILTFTNALATAYSFNDVVFLFFPEKITHYEQTSRGLVKRESVFEIQKLKPFVPVHYSPFKEQKTFDKTKVTLPSKLFPSEKAIPELSPIG